MTSITPVTAFRYLKKCPYSRRKAVVLIYAAVLALRVSFQFAAKCPLLFILNPAPTPRTVPYTLGEARTLARTHLKFISRSFGRSIDLSIYLAI